MYEPHNQAKSKKMTSSNSSLWSECHLGLTLLKRPTQGKRRRGKETSRKHSLWPAYVMHTFLVVLHYHPFKVEQTTTLVDIGLSQTHKY